MTTLAGRENNLPLKNDENGKINHQDLMNSIQFRIDRHKHYIEKSSQIISENIEFDNIVLEESQKILERQAKIHELREFSIYTLTAFDV